MNKTKLILPSSHGHWKHRAVEATGGNQTMLGCFVLAICGWQHGRKPPRFGSTAVINKDGMVVSNMQDKDGRMYRAHVCGPVQTVIDNFRGLADHLKLDDRERMEMFDELRKWFVHDERANATPYERKLMQ